MDSYLFFVKNGSIFGTCQAYIMSCSKAIRKILPLGCQGVPLVPLVVVFQLGLRKTGLDVQHSLY